MGAALPTARQKPAAHAEHDCCEVPPTCGVCVCVEWKRMGETFQGVVRRMKTDGRKISQGV